MGMTNLHRVPRLSLDEVCEMIADGCSLAQIGARFDLSRRVSHLAREKILAVSPWKISRPRQK